MKKYANALGLSFIGAFAIVVLLISCKGSPKAEPVDIEISPDDPMIRYTGRIDWRDSLAPRLCWAGNAIHIRFMGPSIKVRLSDPAGATFFNAIIDGEDQDPILIDCDSSQVLYTVAEGLSDTEHELQLVRRTDPTTPGVVFKGFVLSPKKRLLPPPPPPPNKIEFYGNSITSGHGVLDETRTNNKDLATWDSYAAYPGLLSRALNAEYHSISLSGIGIVRSWFPLTMPYLYDRTDPSDPEFKWDFSTWTPDLVVINLFQNDSWLIKKVYPDQVIQAYMDMVRSIRRKYPFTPIICLLGNMDVTQEGSPWPGYVSSAVERMKKGPSADKNIYPLFVPYKQTSGHPTRSEQQEIADRLFELISKNKLLSKKRG